MTDAESAALTPYKCHKRVQAAKILEVHGNLLLIPGGRSLTVTQEYKHKHNPQAGGYFVKYEDGYESYSPAAAFESGYTVVLGISQDRLPHQQRIVDERAELADKLQKLERFTEGDFFQRLDANERDRMTRQTEHMRAYRNVLDERIGAF